MRKRPIVSQTIAYIPKDCCMCLSVWGLLCVYFSLSVSFAVHMLVSVHAHSHIVDIKLPYDNAGKKQSVHCYVLLATLYVKRNRYPAYTHEHTHTQTVQHTKTFRFWQQRLQEQPKRGDFMLPIHNTGPYARTERKNHSLNTTPFAWALSL